MTLYITRHGQRQDCSAAGKIPSPPRPCDPDITQLGQVQAKETGQALAGNGISVVYTSPFLRTVRTASIIAKECGIKVRIDWGLAEWFRSDWWGEWPGTIHPAQLHRMFDNIEDYKWSTGIMPDLGEDDFWAAVTRYSNVLKVLLTRHPTDNILIVTHGPALIGMTATLLSWGHPGVQEHRQCGITKLTKRADGSWSPDLINSVSHLSHVET
jgi:broad specificity phosphatase PhoE